MICWISPAKDVPLLQFFYSLVDSLSSSSLEMITKNISPHISISIEPKKVRDKGTLQNFYDTTFG